jgi:hypothetical protein
MIMRWIVSEKTMPVVSLDENMGFFLKPRAS